MNSSRTADLVEAAFDLMFIIDARGCVAYASPESAGVFSIERSTLIGTSWDRLVHPDDAAAADRLLQSGSGIRRERLRFARCTPDWRYVAARSHHLDAQGVTVVQCRPFEFTPRDPGRGTESRSSINPLPTRAFIAARIDELLAGDRGAAVFFVDLDRFGRVNDFHGRDTGDEALRIVSARLSAMGDGVTVAAVGGAQFLVLSEAGGDIDGALAMAGRLARAISEEISLDRIAVELNSTIGVALAPLHGASSSEVIRSAEIATATGKKSQRGSIVLYRSTMQSSIADLREDEVELRRGLALRQLFLAYQPEIDLRTGSMAAAEALIRWPDFKHSIERLIRAAEDSQLIVPLGELVVDLAIKEAAQWLRDGHPQRIAINVSPEQVRRGVILPSIERVLDRYGLPASSVELEITEHIVLDQSTDAIRTLGRLRALGATIAIDDFGTGYSSLAYLRRFPVDKLKIDRTFVAGMTENARDAALVDAIVSVATKLGLAVVAEGVEEMDQALMLRDMGCNLGQGYLFGRPSVAEDLPWNRPFRFD